MPALVSVINATKTFGIRPLFESINFVINEKDRVGLIGPNGAGKSTLLKMMAGQDTPDGGQIVFQKGTRVGYLAQVPQFTMGRTVLQTILEGAAHPDDTESLCLAYELISKIGLDTSKIDAETLVDKLSGGWKKRVALARELIKNPDLLLLDEPTNHLDVESIFWLEKFMGSAPFATVTITHDRYFLQKVTSRILELDKRNLHGLLDIDGNFERYLETKTQLMEAQEKLETKMKNTLRRETEWLRSGTRARTTKQHARIERAGELAQEVNELEFRNTKKKLNLNFVANEQKPKRLLELTGGSKAYGEVPLFKNLDLLISPQERLGLMGRNGCGKSTLIRVLLGQEKPDCGDVYRSDHLQVAYFEQNRDSLDPKLTPIKSLSPHGDQVIYNGSPMHVRGYLDRFLFSQEQMNMPVGQLSGGEQSRLLLARLMLSTANLLVLDEPTNDLDLATLALLEDCLNEFEGAVLFVTHDRAFMDRVADRILAFNSFNPGETQIFAALHQWESWYQDEEKKASKTGSKKNQAAPAEAKVKSKKKMGYKEERELSLMESTIHAAEEKLQQLTAESQSSDVMSNAAKLLELTQKMAVAQEEINKLYARWQELEEKSSA